VLLPDADAPAGRAEGIPGGGLYDGGSYGADARGGVAADYARRSQRLAYSPAPAFVVIGYQSVVPLHEIDPVPAVAFTTVVPSNVTLCEPTA